MTQLYFEDVQIGQALPELAKRPTTRQLVMYAGASGDFFEIHYDLEFAKAQGLPNVIVHGALKSAFLGQLVTDWMGPLGKLKRFSAQYRGMDFVNEPLVCKGSVVEKREENGEYLVRCDLWIENSKGEKTTTGEALVSLPGGRVAPAGK